VERNLRAISWETGMVARVFTGGKDILADDLTKIKSGEELGGVLLWCNSRLKLFARCKSF
jgi:hypothetical protein